MLPQVLGEFYGKKFTIPLWCGIFSHSTSTAVHTCRVTVRAFISRDIKTHDPVPVSEQDAALDLMKTGRMYR